MAKSWKETAVLLICLGAIIQMVLFPLNGLFTYKMGKEHKVWLPVFQNLFPFLFFTLLCLPFSIYKFASQNFAHSRGDFVKSYLPHFALIGFLDAHACLGFTFSLRFTSFLSVYLLINAYALFSHIGSYARLYRSFESWRYVLFIFNILGMISFCVSDYFGENGSVLLSSNSHNGTEVQPVSNALMGDLIAVIATMCLTFSVNIRKGLIDRSSKTFTIGLTSFFSLLVLIVYYFIFELNGSIKFLTTNMFAVDDNFYARLYFIGYFIAAIVNIYLFLSIQPTMPNQFYGIIIFFGSLQAIIYNCVVFTFTWNPGHIVGVIAFIISAPLSMVIIQDNDNNKSVKERFFRE